MRSGTSCLVLAAGVLAASCSSAPGVTQTSSVRYDESAVDAPVATDVAPPTVPSESLPDGERPTVALPGLLDDSDAPIPNDPEVETGVLDNGLTYYVRHNDRPGGKAELRLAVKAGSVNEIGDSTGVAHFVEHMLFNGTEQYPENELIDVLRGFGAAFGADVNAYTAFDETVYELSVPSDRESVETGINVLHQWLSHATFDPAQVEAERGVVIDEWRQSTQTVDGRLFDIAQGLYLAGSPYEDRDPIGSQDSIRNVSTEELRAFYDAWYRPDNAALVIVGDIDVGDMVDEIEDRFGDVTPRSEQMPARPEIAFEVDTEPGFALHSDPDQTTVDVEVDLPIPATAGEGTAVLRSGLLDSMIFDLMIRRLDDDITSSRASFDEIFPGTNSFVDGLDAPALYAVTDADRVDDTLQALLDEYERVNRFGFTEAEVALARSSAQAGFDSLLAGRDSTQDAELAEQYVANFLYGDPYPTIPDLHEIATTTIEAITPDALALRFRARWDNTAPHVIISTPADEADAVPTSDEVLAVISGVGERPVEPRDGGRDLPDELMEAPDPVDPESDDDLVDDPARYFDPFELVFPNGARVIATSNDIDEGQVGLLASSLGGSSLVDDDDVIDALYASDVVTTGGVADFNQTEVESILADRDVSLGAWLTAYTENFGGSAGTDDLEILFQLLHLYMTAPRFDQVALTQVQRSYQPVVDEPSSDPDLAGYDALVDTRYPDEPRYTALPTPEQFATLDLAGVERVWRDRFGDAGDWVFTFAGDFDPDELRELAARYIGTLPGDGGDEQYRDLATPPPDGVVRTSVRAGTGETASLMLLFTSPLPDVDDSMRATIDVATEVITARLTDVVRERLGESYSPFAVSYVTSDPTPTLETYVEVTGAPDRVEAVGELVVAELAQLAADGPDEHEFDNAVAQVAQRYTFVYNRTFMEELVNSRLWPERGLDDFLGMYWAIDDVVRGDVQELVATHVPADHYIQVAVLPR